MTKDETTRSEHDRETSESDSPQPRSQPKPKKSTVQKGRDPAPVRRLQTPILVKTGDQLPWPDDEAFFYLLTRDGVFKCRENEFFRSCVKAKSGPAQLAEQKPFYEPRFPMIPRALIERAVGFFTHVAELHGSEAAALFAWDRGEERVRLIVPPQTATIGGSGAYRYPVGVHYEPPFDLPEDWVVFGDIHSHVDYAAYASHTDKEDELHSAGLHVVVGRIYDEPPELHVEAVVDGQRFILSPGQVFEDYERRRMNVPAEWIDRIEIAPYKWTSNAVVYSGSGGSDAHGDH